MWKLFSTQAARVRMMKALCSAALLPAMLMTGCSCMSNTDKGTLAGAGAGAVAGGVIGHAVGNTAAGAVIGGVVGAVTGSAIGNDIDHRQEQKAIQQAVATDVANQAEAQHRGLEEIQRLSANGTADALIINQIRTSPTVYHLTADQIVWLQQNGVHDSVITEMQATAARQPTVVYPGGPPPTTVIVEDRPPVAVRLGYGYYRWR